MQDEGGRYPLVDTHAHLTWRSFQDVPAVVDRARAAGLIRILSVATDVASSERVLTLADTFPEVYAAVGVHPNDVRGDDDLATLQRLAQHERVVAVGETGLDYYRDHTAPELQRSSLRRHLELAAAARLPIIIHNRDADVDVMALLSEYRGRVRGVLHCFGGDDALAAQALDLDYYLSFAGNLTYPGARELRGVAARLPADRVLVETDCPFLSPAPHRGTRNEPAHVGYTFATLATVRGADRTELARQVAANARALFNW